MIADDSQLPAPHGTEDTALPVDQQSRRQFVGSVIQVAASVAALGTLQSAGAAEESSEPIYLERGSDVYERARLNAVWNSRKPHRYPNRIAFITTPEEAVQAIKAANNHGWKVGVRAGGHNWIGNHVRDGGLLLDLSRMSKVEVDVAAQRATIEPGVRSRDLQKVLNDQGFRFPTATCPTVGQSGHLLGGGASFTTRLDGPSCFYVEAADVVLADGTLIHATDKTYPEIMWAVRGAGPSFFGLVTKFYLRIKPLEPAILTSTYIFPADLAEEFLGWHTAISPHVPASTQHTIFAVRALMPQFDGIPIGLNIVAFGKNEEDCRAQIEPFAKAPIASKYLVSTPPSPWTHDQGYSLLTTLYPKSFRFRSEALWVDPTQSGYARLCADAIKTLPNLHAHILWAPYGMHYTHPNTCYSLESAMSLHFYGVTDNPEEDEKMNSWVNGWMNQFRKYSPYNGAGKINDNALDEFPKYFLTPENTGKVAKLRAKYDPKGIFYPCLGTPYSPPVEKA